MLNLFGFFRMNKLIYYSNMAFLTNYMFVIDMCSYSCILVTTQTLGLSPQPEMFRSTQSISSQCFCNIFIGKF